MCESPVQIRPTLPIALCIVVNAAVIKLVCFYLCFRISETNTRQPKEQKPSHNEIHHTLQYCMHRKVMAQHDNVSLVRSMSEKSASVDNVRIADDQVKIVYIVIALLGISGNSVVICVLAKSSAMRRTYANILILNQSVVDLLASVLILATTTTDKFVDDLSGISGEIYCRLWLSDLFLWCLLVSSSYTLMALTFERYMSIVHPVLHHNIFSKSKVIYLACSAWVPGFVQYFCFLIPTTHVVDGQCYPVSNFISETWKKATGVILFVIQYVIPTVCFIFCYIRIFSCLRNRVGVEGQPSNNAATVLKTRARNNVLKTLVIVVVCFILCSSWNQFLFLASNFGVAVNYKGTFYNFTVIAIFSNCCVNPCIYVFKYERYRKELRSIFCKGNEPVSTVMTAS